MQALIVGEESSKWGFCLEVLRILQFNEEKWFIKLFRDKLMFVDLIFYKKY
jgi:hypothetical protein